MTEPEMPPPPPVTPPPAPAGPPGGAGASSNRNLMLVLSYLWIFSLVPLLVEKEDREIQWHAKHGLVLLGAEVLLMIAFSVVSTILSMTGIGCIAGCGVTAISVVVFLGFLVLHVMLMMKAINGQRMQIPGLTPLVDKF